MSLLQDIIKKVHDESNKKHKNDNLIKHDIYFNNKFLIIKLNPLLLSSYKHTRVNNHECSLLEFKLISNTEKKTDYTIKLLSKLDNILFIGADSTEIKVNPVLHSYTDYTDSSYVHSSIVRFVVLNSLNIKTQIYDDDKLISYQEFINLDLTGLYITCYIHIKSYWIKDNQAGYHIRLCKLNIERASKSQIELHIDDISDSPVFLSDTSDMDSSEE